MFAVSFLSRSPRARAFSLLELLVVVGIVALLISILLPSLAKAREQARSTQCLGNLDQQAVAAFMYAYERGGALPSADSLVSLNDATSEPVQAFAQIPRETAQVLQKMLSRASTVFYCPANDMTPFRPSDFEASVTSSPNHPLDAPILYWWLANPTLDTAARFFDANHDGSITDEYIRKVDVRRISNIAISTDQSRQQRPQARDGYGWYFVHGSQGTAYNSFDTQGLVAWKNNLYGDGHAAAVRAPSVIRRWDAAVNDPPNFVGW
jgi:prepilin-type N-terminal cleavage/methylation domain-containing protein